jgi:hypothetical protein
MKGLLVGQNLMGFFLEGGYQECLVAGECWHWWNMFLQAGESIESFLMAGRFELMCSSHRFQFWVVLLFDSLHQSLECNTGRTRVACAS